MITVENKIELFNKVVLEKIKKEQDRLITELDEKRRDTLALQEAESTEKADLFLRAIIEEAYEDKKTMLARAKSDMKKKVLSQRQGLIDHLADAVLKRFEYFVEEPAYEAYVIQMIVGHKKDLEEFNKFFVALDSHHFDRDKRIVAKGLEAIGLSALAYEECSDSIVGGCIFYNEGKDVLIDGTLVSLIEGHRKEIGQRMYLMLNEVGEPDVN